MPVPMVCPSTSSSLSRFSRGVSRRWSPETGLTSARFSLWRPGQGSRVVEAAIQSDLTSFPPDRPALPEPAGFGMMLPVPGRRPVEDLRGGGARPSGRRPGRGRPSSCSGLEVRATCSISTTVCGSGRGWTARAYRAQRRRIGSSSRQSSPSRSREMAWPRCRCVGQRPGQCQAEPAGPFRASRDGRDVSLRVLGHIAVGDPLGKDQPGQLG